LVDASLATQEEAAVYCANRATAGDRPPEGHEQTPANLRALDALPDELATEVCFTAALAALSTSILDHWLTDELVDPAKLAEYLAVSDNNPDSRWCRPTSNLPNTLSTLILSDPTARLATVPTAESWNLPSAHEFVANLAEQLQQELTPSVAETTAIASILSMPSLVIPLATPPPLATVVEKASGQRYAIVPSDDWNEIVPQSNLLLVAANNLSVPLASCENLHSVVDELKGGTVEVVSYSTTFDSKLVVTTEQFSEWLPSTAADIPVCVRGGLYASGLRDPPLERALAAQRHLILMPLSGSELAASLVQSRGLAGSDTLACCVVRHTVDSDVAYFLLWPRKTKNPVAILPSLTGIVPHVAELLSRVSVDIRGGKFDELTVPTQADLATTLTWFAGMVPDFVEERVEQLLHG